MDLCTGGNLLDYMKKNPIHKNSEALARDFLRQMLYAVKYLHEHQIVHRSAARAASADLTPQPGRLCIRILRSSAGRV
jgi:hypothetical protein